MQQATTGKTESKPGATHSDGGKTPRRVYPPHIKPPYTALETQLAETLGRIADRTDAWKAHEAEMKLALDWCRANGNPHIERLT